MRFKHYCLRTETTYREWIRRYILFHGKRHPRKIGGPEVSRFLSDLIVGDRVAASTQNQAFCGVAGTCRPAEAWDQLVAWRANSPVSGSFPNVS